MVLDGGAGLIVKVVLSRYLSAASQVYVRDAYVARPSPSDELRCP